MIGFEYRCAVGKNLLIKKMLFDSCMLGIHDRFRIQMRSREEFIDKENVVRFVYAFVE